MGPISIKFDVTEALPADITAGQRTQISAWLFLPGDQRKLGDKPVAMTLLNGGSYDKRYFHMEIPGRVGYSAAEHLADLGNIVLVPDHLGVGESSKVANQKKATREIVAQACHAAVTQFHERLRSGSLHASLPAIRNFVAIGGGHSMGGMQIITQQAKNNTFDAVMILGYTGIGVHFTIRGNIVRAHAYPPNTPPEDYMLGSRDFLHETFHWGDVPADIVAFDDSMAVPTPSTIGMAAIRTGVVSEDAALIEVPIFLSLGERDVSPDPRAEIACYKRCDDIALQILPRSGHCHNFASTRHQQWDRMHRWAHTVLP